MVISGKGTNPGQTAKRVACLGQISAALPVLCLQSLIYLQGGLFCILSFFLLLFDRR